MFHFPIQLPGFDLGKQQRLVPSSHVGHVEEAAGSWLQTSSMKLTILVVGKGTAQQTTNSKIRNREEHRGVAEEIREGKQGVRGIICL